MTSRLTLKVSSLNSYQKGEGYGMKVKGHEGHGQVRVPNKGRWAHLNVKLLHFKLPSRVGISVSADIQYRPINANISKTDMSVLVV